MNTILIVGDPIDGFQFVGPFADAGDAISYAEEHAEHLTWCTAELQSMECFADNNMTVKLTPWSTERMSQQFSRR